MLSTPELAAAFQLAPHDSEELPVKDALFISLGAPEIVEVTLGQTRWLWLLSAGSVVLGGWFVLVLSQGRRLMLLVVFACLLLMLIMFLPETAMSLSRYLGLGLLLLFAATWSLRFAGHSDLPRSTLRTATRISRSESRTPSRSPSKSQSKAVAALHMESTTSPDPYKETRP